MQYALLTYGIDGWGHPFRFVADGSRYTVTSAGADGAFDTADDLRMTVQQAEDDSWDNLRHAFYVRSVSGARWLLIHRFPGDHFRYQNAEQATALTGGNRFDVFGAADLSPDQATALESVWTEEASGLAHEPLLLQVFAENQTW
jgi:hypothetical protein